MAYFKIDNVDYSTKVNELKINKKAVYTSQTNAAGDSVVDYVNSKREIEVGIIPLEAAAMAELQNAIAPFSVTIAFRNPKTNKLESIRCIIPDDNVEYYTIQSNKVMYKACTLKFIEL